MILWTWILVGKVLNTEASEVDSTSEEMSLKEIFIKHAGEIIYEQNILIG